MRRSAVILSFAVVLSLAVGDAAMAAGWRLARVPGAGQLWAVSCPSRSSCIAVGSGVTRSGDSVAAALRWNGRSWVRQHLRAAGARQSTLFGVSCTSPRACMAVGNFVSRAGALVTLAERWNGKRWAVQHTPNPLEETVSSLADVSCASAKSCTAVGNVITAAGKSKTLAERWSGGRWRLLEPRNPPGQGALSAISCFAPTDCIAVGDRALSPRHTLAERLHGSHWSIQPTPSPRGSSTTFYGVSCPSATACIAVGRIIRKAPRHHSAATTPLAERWDGSRWIMQKTPSLRGTDFAVLKGVSCASVTSCTAIGQVFSFRVEDYLTLAEQWNGSRWTVQRTPSPRGTDELLGVSCSSQRTCTAVGDKSVPHVAHLLPIAARHS